MIVLEKLANGKINGVFLTNEVTANYFKLKNKFSKRIEITSDKLRSVSPVFYFTKNSILTAMFNQKIELCQESGLIIHWLAEYSPKSKRSKNKPPKKLGIVNILAITQISAVMYLISLIVFAMEMLSPTHKHVKKLMDYVTY